MDYTIKMTNGLESDRFQYHFSADEQGKKNFNATLR